ncbi:MAG: GDP-mannose 4,6-dehydratase [Thermoplasmata archaeon]
MADRRALITGITGQDGSYLAEFLLKKGYQVFGIVRRLSSPNMNHIQAIRDQVTLIDGDLMDQSSLNQAVKDADPSEIYNLAAQSFVATSFVQPALTGETTALGALRMLEAMRGHAPGARMYQASSSEMFGLVTSEPQNELTRFHPRSPYGVAKVYAYWASVNYREAYSLFVSNGIFFNHESPRRGLEFVTRKITDRIARLKAGDRSLLFLGNLDARRDWGYAPDYVELMWKILQHKEPDDFVGATGEAHTVREFLEAAFETAGLGDWSPHVRVDQRFYRPSEVFNLRGDPSKAQQLLDWRPSTNFRQLVEIMVQADLERHPATSR